MPDANEPSQDNFGALQIVEPGGGGLNGDTLGAELEDDASGDAEIEALEEEDAAAAKADVTASGAE